MHPTRCTERGFTLIELMITVAIVAILAAIALPSYSAYIRRTQVAPALTELSGYMVRMEQRYQNVGSYAAASGASGSATSCALTLPPNTRTITYTCDLKTGTTPGFTATATGSGPLSGYQYTIDESGTRATTGHPNGVPTGNCWSMRGRVCDS